MEGYALQLWLVWGILAALFMLGAWMRMGFYLFYLGLAALVALVEAVLDTELYIQIGSFVLVSAVLGFCNWGISCKLRKGKKSRQEE